MWGEVRHPRGRLGGAVHHDEVPPAAAAEPAPAAYVVGREPRDAFHDDTGDLWREVLMRQRSSLSMVTTFTDTPDLN